MERLRRIAAGHQRSVESEVRAILTAAVATGRGSVVDALRAAAIRDGGVEAISLPERTETQRPVPFA